MLTLYLYIHFPFYIYVNLLNVKKIVVKNCCALICQLPKCNTCD